jgi:hypothetical protein
MIQNVRNFIMKSTALFVSIAALAACSSISVTSDWDTNVDFSIFETFAVLEEPKQPVNRLVDQRIRAALVAELTGKGLRQVDTPDKADLAIGYQVTTEERMSYQTVHSGWERSSHRFRSSHGGNWGRSVGTSTTRQINFTVGTLIIAAFQMDNKELVWEGSGSRTVNPSSSPEQSEQRINDAVKRILEDFPPGVKSTPRTTG